MNNLTEQWKKGELPEETECYVRVNGDIYLGSIQYKNGCHNKKLPYVKSFNGQFITKYVEEVLAPVPSYEEYQQLLSDQLAKDEGVEINAELEERLKKTQKLELDLRKENTQLKKWCEEFNALEVAKENTKLKELLKECQGSIATLLSKKITEVNGIKQKELLAKISQVLGEE